MHSASEGRGALLMWQVLGALHGLHSLCVFFNVLRPRLYVAAGGLTGAWSVILLNAMNLAVACRCVTQGLKPVPAIQG